MRAPNPTPVSRSMTAAAAICGPLVMPLALGMLLGVGGCADRRLETGYRYRPLSSSALERRAFYADPYSIEAGRAEAERGEGWSPAGALEGQRTR